MWPFSVKEPAGRRCPWWIVGMMIRQWGHPNLDPVVADAEYLLPDDPAGLIRKYTSRKRYIADKRDCDDFVRIVRGNLSNAGLGHVLAMDVRTPGHSCLGFIGRDDRVRLFNAQTGEPETADILGLWV